MKYVFDSGPFINCRCYYPDVFKSYWNNLNELAGNKDVLSVKEVYNEIMRGSDIISQWADNNKEIFERPSSEELQLIREILSNHKELIRDKKITGGLPVADPFILAKAIVNNLTVVTEETYRENAHKIPNVCKEYGIEYFTLERFMIKEGWVY